MNIGAQMHLALNHVPIVGVAVVVAILVVGWTWRSATVVRLGWLAAVAVALSAIPVVLSGNSAEGQIEKIAGVSEALIERHEGAARFATVLFGALGLLSLLGLIFYRRREIARGFSFAVLILAFAATLQGAWTGHLGGQIRHSEIRPGAAADVAPDHSEPDD